MNNTKKYIEFRNALPQHVELVAVSKTKTADEILELYQCGQRDFGENYVQELMHKKDRLPVDIRWHFIGHLQSNKVKLIAPFVHMIHSADSIKLIHEINKAAIKNNRVINCLLQVHVASEETKFGFSAPDLENIIQSGRLNGFSNVKICGVMGMASNSENEAQIRSEFGQLKLLAEKLKEQNIIPGNYVLSMGMSGDFKTAIEEGSTMIRIGSLLFGERNYSKS